MMKRFLIMCILICMSFFHCLGQNPDWGTLLAIDKAQRIVIGTMHIKDAYEGYGTITIKEVLKGDKKIKYADVQFSDKHPGKENVKQAEPPKYFYSEGQEGIWLLSEKKSEKRFNLQIPKVYYKIKWTEWIKNQIIVLKNRPRSPSQNGLSASVIIDSVGANKYYRFFNLCLRNETNKTIFINTHYRIRESSQQRFKAFITSPREETFDMLAVNNKNFRLAGEPGWSKPLKRDFVALNSGKTIYLFASGDLRCFMKGAVGGFYTLNASYQNDFISDEINGKIWTGKISFPETEFKYVIPEN